MGSGSYTARTFVDYSIKKGLDYDTTTKKFADNIMHQDIFKSRTIDKDLDPWGVEYRECKDSTEHPCTKPVILALDVTGSMGQAATEVASSLGVIMENLYKKVTDIQFMTMGIGDFAYDKFPLQVSQFESDIRINEQLDKIYFEFGGGGNTYESYTAAWKFALDHTAIDAVEKKRCKPPIITIGDEKINPFINKSRWYSKTCHELQADIDTNELYKQVSEKFSLYHIHVSHGNIRGYYDNDCVQSFADVIGPQHVFTTTVNEIDQVITNIILDCYKEEEKPVETKTPIVSSDPIPVAFEDTTEEEKPTGIQKDENGYICW